MASVYRIKASSRARGHHVQVPVLPGAIALADAADTESARTTIANFRIIADLPVSRARPDSLKYLVTLARFVL
jgi:hypothetical protein